MLCQDNNMKITRRFLRQNLIPSIIHTAALPANSLLIFFTVEGVLNTLVNNLVNSNNNLFATRLGASDYTLSLVITLPQLMGMLALIPGGIATDRMGNKRNMVTGSLAVLAGLYLLLGFVPAFGPFRLIAFLALLAIASGPMTIYNVSWQAYFSDVVDIEDRNKILTARTGLAFLIGLSVPLISGALLASTDKIGDKIVLHQTFYFIGVLLLLLQIIMLRRIKSDRKQLSTGIGVLDLKAALVELIHNRKFLGFAGVALFFYLTWHIDWTLYFIGQVSYLGMDEAWLSYINIGNALVQFLTIGFWSRLNRRMGVRFAIIFGNLGLALCPVSMIVATSISPDHGKILFLILNTISNIALATTSLNVLQCLLQVIPEKNKTLNISIYTVMVTLSNAVMPLVGVFFYNLLGGDRKAFHVIFLIIFVLRIVSSGLWTLRWWKLRWEPKN